MSSKKIEGWIAVEKGFSVVQRGVRIRSSIADLTLRNGSTAVKIIAIAGETGDHGYVPTLRDELKASMVFDKDVASLDKASCAIATAGWMLNNMEHLSEKSIAILKKFNRWYEPFRLHQMGLLFEVFDEHGIKIEPFDLVLPEGFAFDDVAIKDGDTVENIMRPSVERKVKIENGTYKVERENSYDSEKGLLRFWRKVEGSPAHRFVEFLIVKMGDKSDNRRRGYFRDVIDVAIKSGMKFHPDDFKELVEMTNDLFYPIEHTYKLAIESGNKSAQAAYEKHTDREPFFLSGEKLHVDKGFMWKGHHVHVTSFSQDGQTVVACHQEHEGNKIKTKKVFKIARDDMSKQSEIDLELNSCASALRAKMKTFEISDGSAWTRKNSDDNRRLCYECMTEEWKDEDVKIVDKIDEVVSSCGCGKFFYTSPSREKLGNEMENFVLYPDDARSLYTLNKFFQLAYERTDRIKELCRPLISWHETQKKESEDETENVK